MRPSRLGCLCAVALAGAAACRRSSELGGNSAVAAEGGPRHAQAQVPSNAPPRQTPGSADVTPKLSVPEVAEVLTDAFANAAKAIRPSVVRIDVESAGEARVARNGQGGPRDPGEFFERFFGPGGGGPSPGPSRGTGSGVVFNDAGHILTNHHVVQNADKVTITLVDGRKFEGKVLGSDPLTDVGVVAFTKRPRDLTVARLGDPQALRVGQWVLAVGSPLGLDQSVTAGIVSGLGRASGRVPLSERVRQFIQTDAPINPGNSGGPLVNLAGEVVGINTLITVGPGGSYGFAIPIDQAATVARVLVSDGRVRYPYLGVQITDVAEVPDELRERLGTKLPKDGALVTGVVREGPAATAGLRPGDVITQVADRKVATAADVIDTVSAQKIGGKVRVQYLRDGKNASADVTLRELPSGDGPAGAGPEASYGVTLQTLTESIARLLGVDPRMKGVVITNVDADSPAQRAGLSPGDVILEVDRRPVATAEEATAALAANRDKPRLLRIASAQGTRYVTIRP